jgi:hypothetical protein
MDGGGVGLGWVGIGFLVISYLGENLGLGSIRIIFIVYSRCGCLQVC